MLMATLSSLRSLESWLMVNRVIHIKLLPIRGQEDSSYSYRRSADLSGGTKSKREIRIVVASG